LARKKTTITNYLIANNKFILHKFQEKPKPVHIRKPHLIVFVYQLFPRAKAVTFLYPTKMYCILLLPKLLTQLTPLAKGSKVNVIYYLIESGSFQG